VERSVSRAGEGDGEQISAVVLTHDEARNIVPCLRTLQWAGERVVVDDGSRDATVELAAAAGARILRRPWDHWAGQRNFAIAQASKPWIFFVDADERVPPALAREVEQAVGSAASSDVAGFWVPRQNLIVGHWVRHAGWHPDFQLRLFRRDRGRYDPDRPVHELVLLDGNAERLQHHLVHHNYATWRQVWMKQLRYARAEASALQAANVRARPHNLVLQPLREFRRRYFTLHGYRDGAMGLALSGVLATSHLVMYAHLWRLNRAAGSLRGASGNG
jgi:glycosyltransferase involved in cell wall biosynthesis